MMALNMLLVRWLGRSEYIFGTTKLLFAILMMFFNVIVHGTQPVQRGAFWTWNELYSFAPHNRGMGNFKRFGKWLVVWMK
jgi:amino acid transporter